MSRRIALLALVFCACTPVIAFIPTNSSPRALAPRPVTEVVVLTEGTGDRPAVEVGIVTATAAVRGKHGEVWTDPATFIEALRGEAARRGCDALRVRPGMEGSYEGICIVYR